MAPDEGVSQTDAVPEKPIDVAQRTEQAGHFPAAAIELMEEQPGAVDRNYALPAPAAHFLKAAPASCCPDEPEKGRRDLLYVQSPVLPMPVLLLFKGGNNT